MIVGALISGVKFFNDFKTPLASTFRKRITKRKVRGASKYWYRAAAAIHQHRPRQGSIDPEIGLPRGRPIDLAGESRKQRLIRNSNPDMNDRSLGSARSRITPRMEISG
jgi:hypothetical protein